MDELWKLESVELTESRQFVSKLAQRLKTSRDPALLGELVEFYFKNGSKRARTVLTSLREAHSQDYFDKLYESIQKTSTRLPVLKLLAHTLNSETSWLYRIIDHPLFTAILDQLKTSNDIVVLCSGVFVVTAILPLVPSYIGTHLHELFNIFCSLATIRDTNRLGLTPKELNLHLDVAVYYLFLQLYALFPNNLFQYLRTHFSVPVAVEKFNEAIAPLFYQVQLHPSLITGGVKHELSRSKWGAMEPDDIATLSLQLCLDTHLALDPPSTNNSYGADHTHTTLTGDPLTDTSTPLISSTHTLTDASQPHTLTSPTPHNTPALSRLPEPSGLKSSDELNQFWSPLVTLGSVTPHHSSNISPNDSSRNSVSMLTQHPSAVSSPLSDSALSSTLPTPRGTSNNNSLFTFKNYSPTASIESDSVSGKQGGVTQSAVHAPLEDGGVAADPMSQSVRVESTRHSSSTQSSPKRPIRTVRKVTTPNQSLKEKVGRFIGMFVTRTAKAEDLTARQEDFTEIFVSDVPASSARGGGHLSETSSEAVSETNTPAHKGACPQELEEMGEECLPESLKETHPLQSDDLRPQADKQRSVSEPQSIPSFRPSRSDSQSSDHHDNSDPNQYSELRQHSQTRERNADSAHPYSFSYPERGPTEGGVSRRQRASLSEAQTVRLLQERLQELVDSDNGYSVPTTDRGSVTTSTPLEAEPESGQMNLDLSTESTGTILHEGGGVPQTPPPDLSAPLTLSLNLNSSPSKPSQPPPAPLSASLPTPSGFPNNANTLGVGLASQLFVRRVSVSARKARNQFSDSSASSAHTVMATPTPTPSPAALLDQYINRGVVLHKGHFETIPLTELEGVDWNHFGGCPHSEEFGMMQAQVVLLHSQLMFERYQCMQHARRNRTLLSQARTATKAVEELHTLRDQLHRQSVAVQSLQSDLQRRVFAHSQSLQFQEHLQGRNHLLISENKNLKDHTLRLQEEVRTLRQQNTDLEQRLDHSNDKVAALENDHTHLRSRLEQAEKLKDEVEVLSRELQVLGDLYHQQKVESLSLQGHTHREQEAIKQCAVLSKEKEVSENRGMALRQELGVASARVRELECAVEHQERELQALRGQLELVQGRYQRKVAALEDKYKTVKTISLHLENHILEIKGRTPLVKRRRHKRSSSQPAGGHTHTPHPLHPP